jgi:hypothetical protein
MQNNSRKGSGCTKWAVGCGFALIVLVLVIGAISYYGMKFFGGADSGFRRMTEIVTMDNDIVNQSSFSPPEDGMLSLEQVATLIRIQNEIKEAIGSDYETLMPEYNQMIKEMDQSSDLKNFQKLILLSSRLIGPLHRARKAQIDAINREGISRQEYEWLKTQARLAFDLPEHKFNLKYVLENMKNSIPDEDTIVVSPVPHPQNRTLLEDSRELLAKTLALSAFGF